MRPEGYDLVNSVRALGIELTDAPAPKCLKISVDPELFWMRLIDVKRSLDAFDKAGGVGSDIDVPALPQDEKFKKALDAILRLYELQGGDMSQASNVVKDALGLEDAETPVTGVDNDSKNEKKSKNNYVSLPVFAPNNIKKKKKYKPRINLLTDNPGTVSMSGLKRLGFDVTYVEAISGETMQKKPQKPEMFKKPF